jgi:hypothetical protein
MNCVFPSFVIDHYYLSSTVHHAKVTSAMYLLNVRRVECSEIIVKSKLRSKDSHSYI